MPKYRKRPVVIEAFQMTRERRYDNRDWPGWLNYAWNHEPEEVGAVAPVGLVEWPLGGVPKDTDQIAIQTLEGPLLVSWDDWIIQGVQGELYPCKPDIFAETYEAVEQEDG